MTPVPAASTSVARFPHVLACAADEPGAAARRSASPGAKVVHLLRHGEATHEARAAEEAARGRVCRCPEFEARGETPPACPYWDPALTDSPLTAAGRDQVRAVCVGRGVEVVLAAAAARTLETARLACAGGPPPPPIVALEELRSRVSAHAHTRRHPLATLRARFPEVDFTGVESDADRMWRPEPEPRATLDARAARFLRILCARPERTLAVVSHFTLFLALFADAAATLVIGRNPERPPGAPAFLDCRGAAEPARLCGFLAVGEVRSLLLIPEEGTS